MVLRVLLCLVCTFAVCRAVSVHLRSSQALVMPGDSTSVPVLVDCDGAECDVRLVAQTETASDDGAGMIFGSADALWASTRLGVSARLVPCIVGRYTHLMVVTASRDAPPSSVVHFSVQIDGQLHSDRTSFSGASPVSVHVGRSRGPDLFALDPQQSTEEHFMQNLCAPPFTERSDSTAEQRRSSSSSSDGDATLVEEERVRRLTELTSTSIVNPEPSFALPTETFVVSETFVSAPTATSVPVAYSSNCNQASACEIVAPGATLSVPAGALEANTTVGIVILSAADEQPNPIADYEPRLTPVYTLTPIGAIALPPKKFFITLQLPVDTERAGLMVASDNSSALVGRRRAPSQWTQVGVSNMVFEHNATSGMNVLSAEISGLYQFVAAFQSSPLGACSPNASSSCSTGGGDVPPAPSSNDTNTSLIVGILVGIIGATFLVLLIICIVVKTNQSKRSGSLSLHENLENQGRSGQRVNRSLSQLSMRMNGEDGEAKKKKPKWPPVVTTYDQRRAVMRQAAAACLSGSSDLYAQSDHSTPAVSHGAAATALQDTSSLSAYLDGSEGALFFLQPTILAETVEMETHVGEFSVMFDQMDAHEERLKGSEI